MSADSRFRLAFICTGNRFRSPLGAALLAAETAELPVEVSSAGVLDLGAAPALPEAVELARELGVDLSPHRAQAILGLELEPFDLVLGFEQAHVRTAVVDGGARIEATFTLPELVALLEAVPELEASSDPTRQARARVAQAHAQRPENFRASRVAEIRDPLGRSAGEQRRIAAAVRDQVARLVELLFR